MTLVDALRIKELTLLIASYLLRQTHNIFIKQNTYFTTAQVTEGIYYYVGAIIGVVLTGIAADRYFKHKRFLLIFLLNSMLLIADIYLFSTASTQPISDRHQMSSAGSASFSAFLGSILQSSDLIYLILMPMFIAKVHSEKMSQLSQY